MSFVTTSASWSDLSTMVPSVISEVIPTDMTWTLIYGFIVAFVLAFAVGANDVANSFGTTVGSKVLTLRMACILASIFETLGAVLIGAKVGETIRKGIIDVTIYNDTEKGIELLMVGEVSAMTGAATWQLIATALGLPVSGTHSIVGACIGFSLVAVGSTGVSWGKLGFIIASWFVSPVLSGFLSVSLYMFMSRFILEKEKPLRNGLRCLPAFYAFTFGIISFSILHTGAPVLGLDHLPLWGMFLITLGIMIIIAIITQFILVPRLRKRARKDAIGDSLEASYKKIVSNRNDMEEASPSKSSQRSAACRNDSGYPTPSDSHSKSIVVNIDSLEVQVTNNNTTENATTIVADVMENTTAAQTEDDNWAADPPTDQEPFCKPSLSHSSSYDAGDSDSAFEESKTPEKTPRKSISRFDSMSKISQKSGEDEEEDPQEVGQLFSFLQILTACFGSFAHGGNDVSNAIGPLIALWMIYHSESVVQKAATPWYLLLYGGLGIVAGLWILGRRVIRTIGTDLTKITPSRGFCIELMTALTVLVASNIGIPVSTTHCKVGSVVSIGWFRSRSAVQWSMVRNIALAWFVTLPVSGIISAGTMFLLMKLTL